MKIAELLTKPDKQHLNKIKRKHRNKKEHKAKKQDKPEELSKYDIMELMDIHKSTYKRIRGSWRNG